MTATGLAPEQVGELSFAEKLALAEWQEAQSGLGGYLPAAVRRLPIEARLSLAHDADETAAWQERERRRVAASAAYFIDGYGSIEPPKATPIPFDLWPDQRPVLAALVEYVRLIFLKARRLGLTWLALHYMVWLGAYFPDGADARQLVLSKGREDANELIERIRRVVDRLPPFLQPDRPTGADDSTTSYGLRRGEIKSLPATERAARQETATFVLLDEFAFVPNGRAAGIWTAIQATIEGGGQIAIVSTGNGQTGDGAEFSRLWADAITGRNSMRPLFLPWNARPDRTPEWREEERTNYESDEAFEAEYPETPEQALASDRSIKVYSAAGIDAAQRLGATLWRDGDLMRALTREGVEWGTDWGDFQTFTVYALALGDLGFFVFDELMQAHVEPRAASEAIIGHRPGGLDDPRDGGRLKATASKADAAPAGTNRTFVGALDDAQRGANGDRVPGYHVRVPFGEWKEGGKDRRGVNTVGFLRWLLNRTAEAVDGAGNVRSTNGLLAIYEPNCPLLCAQLRRLEKDPETGKVRKPSLDPRHPERGDHGADALVALAHDRAEVWQRGKESDE